MTLHPICNMDMVIIGIINILLGIYGKCLQFCINSNYNKNNKWYSGNTVPNVSVE